MSVNTRININELNSAIDSVRSQIVDLRLQGQVPKLHPHGFIQLDLSGDRRRRLHAWDDDIPRRADLSTMHDHTWDFKSTVLRGCLVNQVFDHFQDVDGNFMLWECGDRQGGSQGGKALTQTEERYKAWMSKSRMLYLGETYEFHAFEFHDTTAFGPTLTLFEKTREYGGDARVLCKVGHDPDAHDGDPQPDADWMWEKLLALTSR